MGRLGEVDLARLAALTGELRPALETELGPEAACSALIGLLAEAALEARGRPRDMFELPRGGSPKLRRRALALVRAVPAAVLAAPELLGWAFQHFWSGERAAVVAGHARGAHRWAGRDLAVYTALYTDRYMVELLVASGLATLFRDMHGEAPPWPLARTPSKRRPREPRPLREWRVLDPCVGSGHFLLVAFERLRELYALERRLARRGVIPRSFATKEGEVTRTILEANLAGIDIDPRAVEVADLALRLLAIDAPGSRTQVRATPDELGSLAAELGEHDLVATNPPFLQIQKAPRAVREHVRARFPEAAHDLYLAFVARCVELAGPHGIAALVTRRAWLYSVRAARARERLFTTHGIAVLADLGAGAFATALHANVETVLVLLRAGREDALVVSARAARGPDAKARALTRARARRVPRALLDAPPRVFAWDLDPAVARAMRRGPRLGDVARIVVGHQPRREAECVRRFSEVEGPEWRVFRKGGGFKRWTGLDEDRIRLPEREARQRLQGEDLFFREGVTFSDAAYGQPSFRWHEDLGVIGNAGPGIVPRSSRWSAPALCGVLNTAIAGEALRRLLPDHHVRGSYLEGLPVPEDGAPFDVPARAAIAASAARDRLDLGSASFAGLAADAPGRRDALAAATLVAAGEIERLYADWLGTEGPGVPAWFPLLEGFDELDAITAESLDGTPRRRPSKGEVARLEVAVAGRPPRGPRSDSEVEALARHLEVHPVSIALLREHVRARGGLPREAEELARDIALERALRALGFRWGQPSVRGEASVPLDPREVGAVGSRLRRWFHDRGPARVVHIVSTPHLKRLPED